MAVRSFVMNASGVPDGKEGAGPTALFALVQDAMTTALAVSGLDAVTGATAAVQAIGAASDNVELALTAYPVTLLADATLSKHALFKALDDIKAQINQSTVFV